MARPRPVQPLEHGAAVRDWRKADRLRGRPDVESLAEHEVLSPARFPAPVGASYKPRRFGFLQCCNGVDSFPSFIYSPVGRAAAVPGWLQKCQRAATPAESPISTLTALGEAIASIIHIDELAASAAVRFGEEPVALGERSFLPCSQRITFVATEAGAPDG
jgi:hypothetical protein